MAMLFSYFRVALRHLVSQKLYSTINILGLAVGIACAILIGVFVRYELSYDTHYTKAERIYRISRDFYPGEGMVETYLATITPAAAERLALDFPQIEHIARISCCGAALGRDLESSFYEPAFALADPALFQIFDYEWLRGDPATALAEPFALVLTESAAAKHFGREDPMGRTLLLDGGAQLTVTGVIRDLPRNTHLRFDMVGSLEARAAALGEAALQNWNSNNVYTYALLAEGADVETIRAQSADFFERHFQQGSGAFTGYSAVALQDIHLRSHRELELGTPGSSTTVYTFSAIAVFIVLIACINFMNLATARSTQRAREVGVRKSIGAGRLQIVVQLIGESVLLTALATALALTLVELLLPPFATFLGLGLTLDYFAEPALLFSLAALILGVGVVAGSYPALYLSAFEPARVLKGDLTRGKGAATVRKALVVFQFAISIALLIGTTVVFQQNRFARNVELGYEKDRVVVISASGLGGVGSQWETLKAQWLAHPEIVNVTASNLIPLEQNTNAIGIRAEGHDGLGRAIPYMWVDFGFFETYGIDVVAGRVFAQEFGRDRGAGGPTGSAAESSIVLNVQGARELGWTPQEALGKRIDIAGARIRGDVVGVVEDVYLESIHSPRKSMLYMLAPEFFGAVQPNGRILSQASLRISGRNIPATLQYIDDKWSEHVGVTPISRRFLDDDFQSLYETEERQARMLTTFALLAIFIAALGLFGLASFSTERRTKEIGVRKALGGGVGDIVRLFTAEFTKLVLLASALAWPAAYFGMRRWLDGFAYRIDLSILVFAAATAAALVVAWLTVGGVAARAASSKPIKALRYE